MTIFDATHKLFDYFAGNHSFSLTKNFKDVVPITEDEQLDQAVIALALEELEVSEMLKSVTINKEKHYILRRAMETFEQNVTISYPTAYLVANSLNEFCETIGDYSDAADVASIQEKDIRNLAILNSHHKAEVSRLMGEESQQKDFGNDGIDFENI